MPFVNDENIKDKLRPFVNNDERDPFNLQPQDASGGGLFQSSSAPNIQGDDLSSTDEEDLSITGEDAAGAPSGGGIAETTATGSPLPTTGGSFANPSRVANLQKFIQANRGAGQQLAGTITGKALQNVPQAQTAAQQQFGEFTGELGDIEGRLDESGRVAQNIFQSPTQATDEDINTFQNLIGGGLISDAQGLSPDFNQPISQLQDVQNIQQQLGTEPGRFELLRSTVNNPAYTSGAQRLDQLLLQTDPGAIRQSQQELQSAITPALEDVGSLQEQSLAQQQALQDIIKQSQEDIENQFRYGADEQIGDIGQEGYLDIENALGQRLEGRQQEIGDVYDLYNQAIESGQVTPELAPYLGIGEDQPLYNIGQDLQGFLQPATQLNPETDLSAFATPEIKQRYESLRDIIGAEEAPIAFSGQLGGELDKSPLNADLQSLANSLQSREQDLISSNRVGFDTLNNLNRLVGDESLYRSQGPNAETFIAQQLGQTIPTQVPLSQMTQAYQDYTNRGIELAKQGMDFHTRRKLALQYAQQQQDQRLRNAARQAGALSTVGGNLTEDQLYQNLINNYLGGA